MVERLCAPANAEANILQLFETPAAEPSMDVNMRTPKGSTE